MTLTSRCLATALLVLASIPVLAEGSDPRSAFFKNLAAQCGSIYEGYSSFPEEGSFAGRLLRAEIAECSDDEIRVPFAVGDDHSRTWIITSSERGLLLKHDHRHEDGTPDEITMYGGWATDAGDVFVQSFAADAHTHELIPEAATNVWTLTLDPENSTLTYYLERHGEPRFKATLERETEGASAAPVHPAFEPLSWLIGEWEADFRPAGEDRAAPTMEFVWGDENRSYLRTSGTKPTADGGLEPEYEMMVVWHPVRQRFEFLTVYLSRGGRVTEDGHIDLLEGTAVRFNMNVHYAPGATLPFSEGSDAGPEGATVEFRRTFFRQGDNGLRGVFRIKRGEEWVDPLPGMHQADGFPWRRMSPASQ